MLVMDHKRIPWNLEFLTLCDSIGGTGSVVDGLKKLGQAR